MLILFSSSLYCQTIFTISAEVDGFNFSIIGSDTTYSYGDTIPIQLVIHNNTKKKYFIVDIDSLSHKGFFENDGLNVHFQFGGVDWNPDLGYGIYKLKIVEPNTVLNYLLYVDTHESAPPGRYTNVLKCSVYIGLLEYLQELEYLAAPGDGFDRGIKSEDYNKLFYPNHHSIHLGDLNLYVTYRNK